MKIILLMGGEFLWLQLKNRRWVDPSKDGWIFGYLVGHTKLKLGDRSLKNKANMGENICTIQKRNGYLRYSYPLTDIMKGTIEFGFQRRVSKQFQEPKQKPSPFKTKPIWLQRSLRWRLEHTSQQSTEKISVGSQEPSTHSDQNKKGSTVKATISNPKSHVSTANSNW